MTWNHKFDLDSQKRNTTLVQIIRLSIQSNRPGRSDVRLVGRSVSQSDDGLHWYAFAKLISTEFSWAVFVYLYCALLSKGT